MHALPGRIYRDDLHCRGFEISTSNEPWTRSMLEPLSNNKRGTLIIDDSSEIYWRLFIVIPTIIYFFLCVFYHTSWVGVCCLDLVRLICFDESQIMRTNCSFWPPCFVGFPAWLTTELWSTKPWSVFFFVVIHLIILCTVSLVTMFD